MPTLDEELNAVRAAIADRSSDSFSFESESMGMHRRVTVRHGFPGQRALLGQLVMGESEWIALRHLLDPNGPDPNAAIYPRTAGARAQLEAIARSMRAAQPAGFAVVSLHEPTKEISEYARAFGTGWTPYTRGSGIEHLGGSAEITTIENVTIVVHNVPDKFAPALLPTCPRCSSTIVAFGCECPCPRVARLISPSQLPRGLAPDGYYTIEPVDDDFPF